MKLKPFAYLTLDEVKEHLKIPLTNTAFDNRVIRLINTACSRVENYIDRPVIVRQKLVEYRDGNSSNVIVPTQSPIRKVHEIKIDFNRAFDSVSAISADNYILRGYPDPDQVIDQLREGNVASLYEIKGTDIVVRDDNSRAILGRMFSGSVLGSLRLTYDAGLAYEKEDVPDDLAYATLLIIDHLYMASENRDIKHTSKSNFQNQAYDKETGWPQEAVDMLDDYKDYTLGMDDVPQKNNFPL